MVVEQKCFIHDIKKRRSLYLLPVLRFKASRIAHCHKNEQHAEAYAEYANISPLFVLLNHISTFYYLYKRVQ